MVNSKKYFAGDYNAGLHSQAIQTVIHFNQLAYFSGKIQTENDGK